MEELRYKEAISTILRVMRLHRSVVEKRVGELGIHRTQYMLLNYLSNSEGAPSQKQIAQSFDVTPAAIATSLKKMEKNGLIERKSDEADNRVKVITVSEKGRELLEKTRMLFNQINDAMFDGVTEAEYAEMKRVFMLMTDNLLNIGAVDEPKCGFCKNDKKEKQK